MGGGSPTDWWVWGLKGKFLFRFWDHCCMCIFYLLIEAEVVVKLLDSNGDGLWGFENS